MLLSPFICSFILFEAASLEIIDFVTSKIEPAAMRDVARRAYERLGAEMSVSTDLAFTFCNFR